LIAAPDLAIIRDMFRQTFQQLETEGIHTASANPH
jgi:hypothetical protein